MAWVSVGGFVKGCEGTGARSLTKIGVAAGPSVITQPVGCPTARVGARGSLYAVGAIRAEVTIPPQGSFASIIALAIKSIFAAGVITDAAHGIAVHAVSPCGAEV